MCRPNYIGRGMRHRGLGRGSWSRLHLIAATVVAVLALSIGAASALGRNFDNPAFHDSAQQFSATNPQRQDTPNDPGYDSAEPDDEDGVSTTNLYDEQFDL